MFHGRRKLGQRILGAVDLAVDLATLGEYGLEPVAADGTCGERAGRRDRPTRRSDWEALATSRRGACGTRTSTPADFRGAVAPYAGE
jgi:hypothetical protein